MGTAASTPAPALTQVSFFRRPRGGGRIWRRRLRNPIRLGPDPMGTPASTPTPALTRVSFFRPTEGRRENLAMSSAQPDPVAPATPSDPPLAFGARRMTASVVQRDFAPKNPLAADRTEQGLSRRPTALSAVNPYVTPAAAHRPSVAEPQLIGRTLQRFLGHEP